MSGIITGSPTDPNCKDPRNCGLVTPYGINYGSGNREVSLHVKRERVRVTSHLGAQFRYTSRSRTLLGFASRRDVSTEKQGHRCQQMTRQQSIKRARKQKFMHSA